MERHSIFPVVISFYGGKWESLFRLGESRDWIQTEYSVEIPLETQMFDIHPSVKIIFFFCHLSPFTIKNLPVSTLVLEIFSV